MFASIQVHPAARSPRHARPAALGLAGLLWLAAGPAPPPACGQDDGATDAAEPAAAAEQPVEKPVEEMTRGERSLAGLSVPETENTYRFATRAQAAAVPWVEEVAVEGAAPALLVDWTGQKGRDVNFGMKDGTTLIFLHDGLPKEVPRAAYAELAKANLGRIKEAARALPGATALEYERFVEKLSEPDPGPDGAFAAVTLVRMHVYDAHETPAPDDVRVMWTVAFSIPFGAVGDRLVHYGHHTSFPEACELWERVPVPADGDAPAASLAAEAEAALGAAAGDGRPAPAGWKRLRKASPGLVNLGG